MKAFIANYFSGLGHSRYLVAWVMFLGAMVAFIISRTVIVAEFLFWLEFKVRFNFISTHGLLSVISPQDNLSQQINPESGNPEIVTASANTPEMQRALAYYQGASYIYKHQLNAWNEAPRNRQLAQR